MARAKKQLCDLCARSTPATWHGLHTRCVPFEGHGGVVGRLYQDSIIHPVHTVHNYLNDFRHFPGNSAVQELFPTHLFGN